jgi:hypothetical protein
MPSTSLYLPTGQAVHELIRELEPNKLEFALISYPLGQTVQEGEPGFTEKEPTEHLVQFLDPVNEEKVPAGQMEQAVEPFADE